VLLRWVDNATNETGFRVERATDAAFTQNLRVVADSTEATYLDTNLDGSAAYYYRVFAYNHDGDSHPSTTATVQTLAGPPAAPTELAAYAASASEIVLTWADNSTVETGFRIDRATDPGFTQGLVTLQAPPTTDRVTVYTDTGLTALTTYYYRVRATNGLDSAHSNVASAFPTAPPTIATPAAAVHQQGWTSVDLSVLGADDQGESQLKYSWSVVSAPPGALGPAFWWNNGNAAKNTHANVYARGPYTFQVSVTDGVFTTVATVDVTVGEILSGITVDPPQAALTYGATQQFNAVALDQFGQPMGNPPPLDWKTEYGMDGTLTEDGLYTADWGTQYGIDRLVVTSMGGFYSAEAHVTLGRTVGTVFNDRNSDGVRDAGEEGLPGWQVGVDMDGDGRHDGWTPTDQWGNYGINNDWDDPVDIIWGWDEQGSWENTTYPAGSFTVALAPGQVAPRKDIGMGAAWVAFLNNVNQDVNPETKALSVSNFVTTDALSAAPQDSAFASLSGDPDNFRMEVKDPDLGPEVLEVHATLEIIRAGVSLWQADYALGRRGPLGEEDKFRGPFLRLVTDDEDNAVPVFSGSTDPRGQTLKVRLGDALRLSYFARNGRRMVREIQVGRPMTDAPAKRNNGNDQGLHDIREVKVNFLLFDNPQTQRPWMQGADTLLTEWVDTANERLAQSGIRLKEVKRNWARSFDRNQPGTLVDGFNMQLLGGPWTADEKQAFWHDSNDPTVIDVYIFHMWEVNNIVPGATYIARLHPGADNAKKRNNIILNGPAMLDKPLVLAHEIMHVLLNSDHRDGHGGGPNDPAEALFKGGSRGKPVEGTKRIGPFKVGAHVGDRDTFTIRDSALALPQ
jgi:hypothetical protein